MKGVEVLSSPGSRLPTELEVAVPRAEMRPQQKAASVRDAWPANIFVWAVRLAGIASYLGIGAIVVLSLIPGELRPTIGFAKAIEHAIAYSIVGAFLATLRSAIW